MFDLPFLAIFSFLAAQGAQFAPGWPTFEALLPSSFFFSFNDLFYPLG